MTARPELSSDSDSIPRAAAARLYFFGHGMLLAHGVIHEPTGPGRFPSLELLPILEETPLDRVVWGRRIDAVAFALGDPLILDIVSYFQGASTGPPMLTLGTIVCHYIDREGEFVRSLREELRHAGHRLPPPPVDADGMREGLVYTALQPYISLNVEDAAAAFMKDWRKTSYVHEIGHIFGNQNAIGLPPQSGEGEALAYLTELRYGSTPHYTLHNMFNVGAVRGIQPHGAGMRIVFDEFARCIREAKTRGDEFATIECGVTGESLLGDEVDAISYQFPKLTADEIRTLANRVFERRFRPRMSE